MGTSLVPRPFALWQAPLQRVPWLCGRRLQLLQGSWPAIALHCSRQASASFCPPLTNWRGFREGDKATRLLCEGR